MAHPVDQFSRDGGSGLGDREPGVHPGGVVVGEVADQFILPGRQVDGHPA